jgi:hypothetical protein
LPSYLLEGARDLDLVFETFDKYFSFSLLILGLSQITHLGGYHGSYAEEPSQQVQTGSSD